MPIGDPMTILYLHDAVNSIWKSNLQKVTCTFTGVFEQFLNVGGTFEGAANRVLR